MKQKEVIRFATNTDEGYKVAEELGRKFVRGILANKFREGGDIPTVAAGCLLELDAFLFASKAGFALGFTGGAQEEIVKALRANNKRLK